MMIEHLRQVMEQLANLPEDQQEQYATELESELQERQPLAPAFRDVAPFTEEDAREMRQFIEQREATQPGISRLVQYDPDLTF